MIEKEEKARPTPGPWEVVQAEPDWPLYIRQPAQKLVIATVHGLPNAQANANLIAAAPSLLAAAKRIVPFVQVDYDSARSDPFASFEDVAALHELEAAIAEAEGLA